MTFPLADFQSQAQNDSAIHLQRDNNIMSWGKALYFTEFVDIQLLDLQSRFGMAMWFLTRRCEKDSLLLNVCGEGYQLEQKNMLAWRDSLYDRCLRHSDPVISPNTSHENNCRKQPSISGWPTIGAYLGLPLHDHTGTLFGTLCAVNPDPRPDLDCNQVRTALQRQAHLLETALVWNLSGLDQQRVAEFFEEESRHPETGLLDDNGWLRILNGERQRCRCYGLNATVLKLYGATLDQEQRELVADSLAALIRHQDTAAYLGADQFAVLLPENTPASAVPVRERLLDALNAKGILMRCEAEPLTTSADVIQPFVVADGSAAVH